MSAFLVCLFASRSVSACSCGGPAPACAYVGRAAAVFVGRVVFTDHDSARGLAQRTLVRFEVEESFRGLASDAREVWIDPGSFTSCYEVYRTGQRWLIFAYAGPMLPPDTPAMTVASGQKAKPKPLPPGIDAAHPPTIYTAPECSGSWLIVPQTEGEVAKQVEYLRQYRDGSAASSVIGQVTIDSPHNRDGIGGAELTLVGNGRKLTTRTDSQGQYIFDRVPPGEYSVTAALAHYVPGWSPQQVEVADKSCGYAKFWMRGTGVVQGLVLDQHGHPAKRVTVNVTLNDSSDGFQRTKSDANGQYRFENLSEGNYEIGVNTVDAPREECPYPKTVWNDRGNTSLHLSPGEHRILESIVLPRPLRVHTLVVEVRWPSGRPARHVNVSAEAESGFFEGGETNNSGVASFRLVESGHYKVEAFGFTRRARQITRYDSSATWKPLKGGHLILSLSPSPK